VAIEPVGRQETLVFRRVPALVVASVASLVLVTSTALGQGTNDPRYVQGYQWGLHNTAHLGADIHADAAWDITTGSRDVAVMVLDVGVDWHRGAPQGAGRDP
jgi:hypothetical protein